MIMKKFFLLSLLLFGFLRCKQADQNGTNTPDSASVGSRPDTCQLFSTQEVPNINRLTDWLAEERLFLRTNKEGKWQIEVYTLYSCELKAIYSFPENNPAESPYYLANLNYNHNSRLVGIRADRSFYVLDLRTGKLSDAIQPQFPTDWPAEPESGRIQHLEVWEDYLVGATTDWGCFVFTLDSLGFEQIPPIATYQAASGQYHALFLIANNSGYYQAILPSLSETDGSFSVQPIFSKPLALDASPPIHAASSPYVRLKQSDGELIGIDLRNGQLLPTIEKKQVDE